MVPELHSEDRVRLRACVVATFGILAWGNTASGQDLSDEDLLRLAEEQAEIIEIWDERPDKPYDRDTEVRLTGEELARRGATDLASALSLIPEINVREVGRGGFNVDIRGARKGAVRVLVDGVSVTDPFYGTFDVSTIPITDIVQIRVSAGPASPIDGPGGSGGVIEVHTRDAAGSRLVVGRLTSDSLPTFGASATGRTALAPDWALRLSTSALWGMREFDLATDSEIGERRRATTGTTRLEYRPSERRRLAIDGFVDDRRYVPPPNEVSTSATILLVDRETSGRAQIALDEQRGKLQLQGRAWTHALARQSRYFRDPGFTDQASDEDLFAMRVGGTALATRPIIRQVRWVASATVDYERARVAATAGPSTVVSRGDVTLIEAAAGAQYEDGAFRVDAAAGVAVPLGQGDDPWPEAKLVGRYRIPDGVELIATLAHKGRVPSLRELYDSQSGNPALDPEITSHGELKAVARPNELIEFDLAGYYKRSEGTMRLGMDGRMVNLGTVDIRGADGRIKFRPHATFALGAAYGLTLARARNDDASIWMDDPLDRLPAHRGDAWVEATPVDRVSATARVRYFGDSIDRDLTVPDYTLFELSASATWRDDWMAVLKCDDVLDTRPPTRNGVYMPGRVFSLIVQGTWD
jgi:hypothetical protein